MNWQGCLIELRLERTKQVGVAGVRDAGFDHDGGCGFDSCSGDYKASNTEAEGRLTTTFGLWFKLMSQVFQYTPRIGYAKRRTLSVMCWDGGK